MSTAGLFLLIAVAVGVATFILWPLISTPNNSAKNQIPLSAPSSLAALQADRAAILTTLRDLDFDFETGKLIEEDYHRQREQLLMRGAEILRRIDALEADEIETAVAAKRRKPTIKPQ